MLCTLDDEPPGGAWSFFGTCPGGPVVAKKELEQLYGDSLVWASSGKTGRIAFSLAASERDVKGGDGGSHGSGFPDPDPRTLRTLDRIYLSVGRLRLIELEPVSSRTACPQPETESSDSGNGGGLDIDTFAHGLELLQSRWGVATQRWLARYAPPTVTPPENLAAEEHEGEGEGEDAPVTTFRVDSSRVSRIGFNVQIDPGHALHTNASSDRH